MSYAFLDISIGRAPSNRVIIELFDKIAPETCHFFKSLLSSSPGYKSTLFTRIIEDFMIQGGDVPEEASLNCPSEMENPTYPVDKPGLVGMARTSAAEKNAQFFITLVEAQHLNGQHTIFGKVVKGMEVVNRIGGVEVDDEDKPVEGCKVLIVGCGELQQREKVEEKPVSPERKKKLVEEDRERSVSPRRDDETRRKRSRSSREDKYEQRRRSSSRDGERRHRHHHHHHRHHRRSKYGDSELDKNDADRDTERSECHTKHDDRDADSSRRDSTPTGPRAYQERRQYRPESNYGRLGYDTGYDDWRDDEDRLREIERQREEERGREEPQIIFKGRGAMKYREPRSFGSSRY